MKNYIKSKYTIEFKMDNKFFIFNSLYGTLDLIENEIIFNYIKKSEFSFLDSESLNYLHKRKYINLKIEEDNLKIKKDNPLMKIYLAYSYRCNLQCIYCFENKIEDTQKISIEKLEFIFKAIFFLKKQLKFKDVEIILYGGEPLLKENKKLIETTFQKVRKLNYKISIITNGTNLKYYTDLLKEYKENLGYISITIDGNENTHNLSRPYKDRTKNSYRDIILSLKNFKEEKLNMSIRINLSKTSNFFNKKFVEDLYQDIGFFIPLKIFLVEDNRELGNIENIMTFSEAVEFFSENEVKELLRNSSIKSGIKIFNNISKRINNSFYDNILYKYCEIGTFFTFDSSDNIYMCPESINDKDFSFGSYYPNLNININKILDYKNNNFLNEKCKVCKLYPICLGGCSYKRFNKIKKGEEFCQYSDILLALKKYIKLNILEN